MFRIFDTIGQTFRLMGASWRVLQKDRELLLFPMLGVVSAIIVAAVFFVVANAAGTFDRLGIEDASAADQLAGAADLSGATVTPVDVALAVLLYFGVTFCILYFNTALVAAALERLRGGDPTISSGLRVASSRIPSILGWAIITGTVGLILRALSERSDNVLAKIVLRLIGGAWAAITFFVVPVLIVEGVGPWQAIKRSGSLLQHSWGEQFVANFGFGIFMFGAVLIGILFGVIFAAVNPLFGLAVGFAIVAIGATIVATLEGIFKAALYEHATGKVPAGFEDIDLRRTFAAKA